MMAISLWQPWATLWLLTDPDEKVFETRRWYTQYRGELWVHAAKKRDGEVREFMECPFVRERLAVHGLKPSDLAFGALIGRVSLIGCCKTDAVLARETLTAREMNFGNWDSGRYAWERGRGVRRLKTPIPYKGAQGFFTVPASVLERAE